MVRGNRKILDFLGWNIWMSFFGNKIKKNLK